jgi:hypothetical protein
MFGQMNVEPLLRFDNSQRKPAPDLDSAVARLLEVTEHPKVVRWMQFPRAVLIFLMVPEDPESGAFYVYDRMDGTWFWVDFEDEKFGGYNLADFEQLVGKSHFLRLVEKPWLLECDGKWFVQPGDRLRCRFDPIPALT